MMELQKLRKEIEGMSQNRNNPPRACAPSGKVRPGCLHRISHGCDEPEEDLLQIKSGVVAGLENQNSYQSISLMVIILSRVLE